MLDPARTSGPGPDFFTGSGSGGPGRSLLTAVGGRARAPNAPMTVRACLLRGRAVHFLMGGKIIEKKFPFFQLRTHERKRAQCEGVQKRGSRAGIDRIQFFVRIESESNILESESSNPNPTFFESESESESMQKTLNFTVTSRRYVSNQRTPRLRGSNLL